MLWLLMAVAQADTGCPELPGEFVDGACVQALDCEVLDCRSWDALPKEPFRVEMWRCSAAGEIGFYRVNYQTSWIDEYFYDHQGVLRGLRHSVFDGTRSCCEDQEVFDVGWGDISGSCVAPILVPNDFYRPPEACEERVPASSSGCATHPGWAGGLIAGLGALLLLWRRRVV